MEVFCYFAKKNDKTGGIEEERQGFGTLPSTRWLSPEVEAIY